MSQGTSPREKYILPYDLRTVGAPERIGGERLRVQCGVPSRPHTFYLVSRPDPGPKPGTASCLGRLVPLVSSSGTFPCLVLPVVALTYRSVLASCLVEYPAVWIRLIIASRLDAG